MNFNSVEKRLMNIYYSKDPKNSSEKHRCLKNPIPSHRFSKMTESSKDNKRCNHLEEIENIFFFSFGNILLLLEATEAAELPPLTSVDTVVAEVTEGTVLC